MRYNKYFIIGILLLFAGNTGVFAQVWLYEYKKLKSTESTLSFQEKQKAFHSYWKNREVTKGDGYKQFRRLEYFLEPRIGDSEVLKSTTYWNSLQNGNTLPKSAYDTVQWLYVGPPGAPTRINTTEKSGNGRLNCIAFHPTDTNKLYVGAPSGGLWISNDNGQTWNTNTDKLNAIGISDIVIAPNEQNTIYVATGDGDFGDTYAIGIIKSSDDGNTWEPTALSMHASNNIYFRRIIMHPQNSDIMLATSSRGIYKTIDAWESYSLVSNGDFKDLEINLSNPDIIYATTFNEDGNAKIYRSINGGNDFSITGSGLSIDGNVNRIELAVTSDNPNLVFALCSSVDGGFYALYRSSNNGLTWSILYDNRWKNLLGRSEYGTISGGQGWYDLALAVSPTNSNDIMVGGINLWRSTNGGTEWNLSSYCFHNSSYEYVHADHHMLVYSPHSEILYSANDGGIYRSNNNGGTWLDISNNLQILQTYKLGSSVLNKNKFICGNQDNGTFFRDETGWSWVLQGDGMHCYIDEKDENILYGSGFYGNIYKSTNGGEEFIRIKPEPNLKGAWVTPFVLHPHNSSVLYVAYKDIYKSYNAGKDWFKISNNLCTDNLQNLAVAPSDDNYIYTASYNQIFKTTNGGNHWVEIPASFTEESITSICISPNDPNKIWVSVSGYNEEDKIYYSATGGDFWKTFSSGLPNVPVNKVIMRLNSNNELFAATDIGVYYRNSDTSSWTNYSSTLPNVIVSDLEIIESHNVLRVATYGRGIWEASLPPALPSKANFNANITSGCLESPIELYYSNNANFDSLKWVLHDAEILGVSGNNDTIIIRYNTKGEKNIQLIHYFDSIATSEIKYNYLAISDTLNISLLPSSYFVCDSSPLDISLRKGYEYTWSPDKYIDTLFGNEVTIEPLEDITYKITAQHGHCKTIVDLPIIYMPDYIKDAFLLSVGATYEFSNKCASSEENEPTPPVGTGELNGCLSQDGWCANQDSLENSLWFKVVVPKTKEIRITVEGFDSQIALYSTPSHSELLLGNYILLAANDDISEINSGSKVFLRDGLTAGDTLYLQIDGSFNGESGTFIITVSDKHTGSDELDSFNNEFNITLSPNPSNENTLLTINNCLAESMKIELFSDSGALVYQKFVTSFAPTYKISINTSTLKGLYILRVSSKENVVNNKLIVL